MTVAICLSLRYASASTIAAILAALVDHNVELYRRKIVTSSPWPLRWVPDSLVICDAESCWLADTSTMQDVAELEAKKQGSCGPLACAYAAWLITHDRPKATVELASIGKNKWHVRALDGRRVYDPQIIGVDQHGQAQA